MRFSYCILGTKAQVLFANLKKRYLKKRNELKLSKKSGTSAEAVLKAEKNFKPYQFLVWLDEFLQLRKGKTNLTSCTNIEDLDGVDDVAEELPAEDFNPGDSEEEEENGGFVVDNEETPREAIVGKQQRKAKSYPKKRAREEALISEMEFSVIKSLERKKISERKFEQKRR